MIVFMYIFWISVPNIFAQYITQEDYSFNLMLPVTKKQIASSKILALICLELLQIAFVVIFGIIHNQIYGQFNFFLDISPSLFGYAFLVYGIFNVVFFPLYFKTAYFYGKPSIIAIAITSVIAIGIEMVVILVPKSNPILDPQDLQTQLIYLFVGIIAFIICNLIAMSKSTKNYENIK